MSVHAQDFTDFEVIVVDDGSGVPVELPSSCPVRTRLIRTTHRGVGAARNAGLTAARGELVAYCDDDDEWKHDHLSILYRYLCENPDVDLVYADSEWNEPGIEPTVAYSIDYEYFLLSYTSYIFATDVMHRTGAACRVGGFDPSLHAFEDWDLWLRMSQACTLRHLPKVLSMHHWHPTCVSAEPHWEDWQAVQRKHCEQIRNEGFASQHPLRPNVPAQRRFDSKSWSPARKQLVYHAMIDPTHSFGYVGEELLLAIERQGIDIIMDPLGSQPQGGLERFYKPLDDWGKFGLYYHHRRRPSELKTARVINYTMWETTEIPRKDIDEINRSSSLVYVPCRQNAESYRECGAQTPIKVLHHGISSDRFPYIQRTQSDVFTFGTYGALSPRKGIDVLIRAFQDEFSSREPVRLLLKSTGPLPEWDLGDANIHTVTRFTGPRDLLGLLRQMDAFVLPSRGEGFGLTGLEAMATGLPLIATNWSGPVEYLDPADSYPLSYELVDAVGIEVLGVRYFGQWAEPNYEHLRSLMRWIYEHPAEAREKGRLASLRVIKEWTWDRVARQFCHELDELAEGTVIEWAR
jgi:glycosyltransferase involved in cell wall biosynthesis